MLGEHIRDAGVAYGARFFAIHHNLNGIGVFHEMIVCAVKVDIFLITYDASYVVDDAIANDTSICDVVLDFNVDQALPILCIV